MRRKCIYTGLDSDEKDSVIPRDIIVDQHNWSGGVPVSASYKQHKKNRLPTSLEMEAVETFYLLEMARLKVEVYSKQLAEIQAKINSTVKLKPVLKNQGHNAAVRKEKQIKAAIGELKVKNMESALEDKIKQMVEEKGYTEPVGLWDE